MVRKGDRRAPDRWSWLNPATQGAISLRALNSGFSPWFEIVATVSIYAIIALARFAGRTQGS